MLNALVLNTTQPVAVYPVIEAVHLNVANVLSVVQISIVQAIDHASIIIVLIRANYIRHAHRTLFALFEIM